MQEMQEIQEMQEMQVQSLSREDALEKEMASHSSISCMENYMDGEVWQATVHGVAKELDTTEQLRMIVLPGQHGPGDRQAPAGGLQSKFPPSVLCTSVFMALPPQI